MNVAIYVYHTSEGYSGGRLSAMTMAVAVAKHNSVTYITNVLPRFSCDYFEYEEYDEITFNIDNGFECKFDSKFDVVIVVPDGCYRYFYFREFYLKALKRSYSDNAKLLMINFETPNWFNSVSEFKKDEIQWRHWLKTAYYSDGILSLAHIGTEFAKKFYKNNASLSYYDCHLAINQAVADKVKKEVIKSNQIVVFCRFGNPHKGNYSLLDVISESISGYTIKIIVGSGVIPDDFNFIIREKAEKYNIEVVFLVRISEFDKYSEIAKSKLLLFFSDFEGYGLPPVEALYMNVPVIAKYLDVLYEVSGDRIFYIEDVKYFKTLDVEYLASKMVSHSPQIEMVPYAKKLNEILCDIVSLPSKNKMRKIILKIESTWLEFIFFTVGRHLDDILAKRKVFNLFVAKAQALLYRISTLDFWRKLLTYRSILDNRLRCLSEAKNVVVYGIGDHSLAWSKWCVDNNKKVVCYVHSHASAGGVFNERPVVSHDLLGGFEFDIVILATVSPSSAFTMLANLFGLQECSLFFARNKDHLGRERSFYSIVIESYKLIDLKVL